MKKTIGTIVIVNCFILISHFFAVNYPIRVVVSNAIKTKVETDDLIRFKAISLNSDSIDIEKYLSSNDYLVLNFWATWCKPCLEEIEILNSIYNKYNSKGIKFIAISCDNNKELVVKLLQKKDFLYEQVYIKDIKSKYDLWEEFNNLDPMAGINIKVLPIQVLYNQKTGKIKVIKSGLENEEDFDKLVSTFFELK